ncbi:hypothetical protein [Dactylosporangium darangshiense]
MAWLGRQFVVLLGPALGAVRRRRLRDLWMGAAAAAVVTILALAFRTPSGHAFLTAYAITRPGDPLYITLVKLPLSMFAPAALLPYWFAVMQVFVVYTLVQALVGARRTLVVAFTGHAVATMSTHMWILLGPPIGIGHRFDHFGDAGPSVAVISLLAYAVVACRASWLAIVLIAYHAIEIGIFNGVAQREHLIGTFTGALLAVAGRLATRRRARGADAGPPPWTALGRSASAGVPCRPLPGRYPLASEPASAYGHHMLLAALEEHETSTATAQGPRREPAGRTASHRRGIGR